MIDTIFYSIELALILHIALGFIAKYPQWLANGRTFHPEPVEDELPALPELLEEAAALVEKPAPAAAAPMAAPVAISVARVEETPAAVDLAALTSQQLRKECSRRGIAWRNAHGQGKHLLKGEMLQALT